MPQLVLEQLGETTVLTDRRLRAEHDIVVAFSTRTGGHSHPPYASLNLAAHVGDHPTLVDENRMELLSALGLASLRDRLTTAEQVHGRVVREVLGAEIGMGAFARAGSPPRIPATDAMYTIEQGVPLLMLFADCVPVVLVARDPVRAVAVVHSGWRGAYEKIVGVAARRLADRAGCTPSELLVYVGPHIGPCHYQVDEKLLYLFEKRFGTICAAQGRLDLGAVVSQTLNEVGVIAEKTVHAGLCTAERTDLFFSYRAEGVTGRHGALAAILGQGR